MANETSTPNRVIFSYVAANRLEVLIGGGIKFILFGAIFFVPGLALMLMGFSILHVADTDAKINGVPVLGLFGLLFFLVGSAVSCYRRWLTFDLSRRSLTIESGMLIPMFRRERNVAEFISISIQHQIQTDSSGGRSSQAIDVYPVILIGRDKGNDFIFNAQATYAQAYTQAATLAKFLDLPIRDISTDHPLDIAPSDLAHPLQARLQADAAIDPLLNAPAMERIHIDESPTGALVTIPYVSKITLMNYVVVAVAILAITIFLTICFNIAHPSSGFRYIVIGCAVLIGSIAILVQLIKVWIARHSSTVLTIDSHAFRVEERCGKRTRSTVVIPIADIIDIDYSVVNDPRRSKFSGSILRDIVGSKGITLKTKVGLYNFAAGLPDNEVEYIYSLIEKALRGVLG